jgi:hypothetical protein
MREPLTDAAWALLWRQACSVMAVAFGDADFRTRVDLLDPPPDLPALGAWLAGPAGSVGLVALAALRALAVADSDTAVQGEAAWALHLFEAGLAAAGVDADTRRQVVTQAGRTLGGDAHESED